MCAYGNWDANTRNIRDRQASRGLLRDCEIFGNLRITFVSRSASNQCFVLTKQHVSVLSHDLGPEAGHHLEAGAAAVLGRENVCREMGLLDYVK